MTVFGSSFPAGALCARFTAAAVCAALLAGALSSEEALPAPPVAEAIGGAVMLTPDNTQPLVPGNRRLARIAFSAAAAPVLSPERNGPAHQMLRRMVALGQAAGNAGDLYENRDRGHSRLPPEAHPQLTHVLYSEPFRAGGLDYGLALTMLFDAPVIGNSSTALTSGARWRSLARLALASEGGAGLLYENYATGQMHVYPEHHDHDPEQGDLIPANTPYILISQGSSGSDQPHLEALAMILAAFRPDTKEALKRAGLIAPTLQMVYRRARVGVRSRAAYLSGAAHPTAFRPGDIELARMVGLANSILPGEIPPMVRLKVVEETPATEGTDFFGEGLSETLFDTPSAIARVWRSSVGRRSMIVSAAETRDPNGRGLRFDWVVLRGDLGRVRVEPLGPEGREARIVIDWQDPQSAPGTPEILSRRVDIGVFANNGVHDSAPAFISVLLPRHERRTYETGPDGEPRPASIDRGLAGGEYADPVLFPETPWRDEYHYDAGGRLTGWTRHRADGTAEYDARGRRVLPSADGAPGPAVPRRYLVDRNADGTTGIREQDEP